jgi:hypothetical protein
MLYIKKKGIWVLPHAYSVEHGVSVIDITPLLSHLSLPLVLLMTNSVQNIASDTHCMWRTSSNTCACFVLTIKVRNCYCNTGNSRLHRGRLTVALSPPPHQLQYPTKHSLALLWKELSLPLLYDSSTLGWECDKWQADVM